MTPHHSVWLRCSCVTVTRCHVAYLARIYVYFRQMQLRIPASESAANEFPSPFKHPQDNSSVISPRSIPQGRAATWKNTYKGSISLPFCFSPTPFLSLTHTRSLFSSPLKRMPKDRSKKMNRSQPVSWQQRAEAHKHDVDQQENL